MKKMFCFSIYVKKTQNLDVIIVYNLVWNLEGKLNSTQASAEGEVGGGGGRYSHNSLRGKRRAK